jgi:hypothetical protein
MGQSIKSCVKSTYVPMLHKHDATKTEVKFHVFLTSKFYNILLLLLLLLLFLTAIGFALGGSSPTLVQAKTMKKLCTIITTQYNNTYTIQ